MEARTTPVCKAIIQEGPRKGQSCLFPPDDSGYCGRHERNKIYDNGILEGKKWCRFFFRGCNNTISDKILTCEICLQKKHEGKQLCKHEGCKHHVKSEGFCKKHERDVYYIEEKEKGFKYCDIARGCFNICNDNKKSCEECLEKERVKDKERYDKRKELHNALKIKEANLRKCINCKKEFDNFCKTGLCFIDRNRETGEFLDTGLIELFDKDVSQQLLNLGSIVMPDSSEIILKPYENKAETETQTKPRNIIKAHLQ